MGKRPRIFYGWVVLAVAFTTIVIGYSIRNTFSVFYPTIVEEFGWERGSTALMFSITILIYGLVAPVAGGLVDKFGPRLMLPVGASIMGGGIALCGLGQDSVAILSPLWGYSGHRTEYSGVDSYHRYDLKLVCEKAWPDIWHPECRLWC